MRILKRIRNWLIRITAEDREFETFNRGKHKYFVEIYRWDLKK